MKKKEYKKEINLYRKNILISGGWGYGNLGDEAILNSTLKLVRKIYPDSIITVMSYDIDITKRNISAFENLIVVDSIHRLLVGNFAHKKFNYIKNRQIKEYSSINFIIAKICRRFNKYLSHFFQLFYLAKYKYYKNNLSSLRHYQFFAETDLFVMAGGGYMNSWRDSLYAHLLESYLADKLKKKSIFIGQSVGPFKSEKLEKLAFNAIKKIDIVSVRDSFSKENLNNHQINAILIPDAALFEVHSSQNRNNQLLFIINNYLSFNGIQLIKKAIMKLYSKNNFDIKILVTRLWYKDIQTGYLLEKELKTIKKLNVEYIIPKSLKDLNKEIASGKIVISQNMHGMILAWRMGIPCISLTDKNKFLAFLEQTNQKNNLINLCEMGENKFILLIEKLLNEKVDYQNIVNLSGLIYQNYIKCFNEVEALT